jgi:Type II secretion system (T2SS), protein E, N-terminal domain
MKNPGTGRDGERMIPRLFSLRHVSRRYYQIVPLEVMKRYQCVVIGRAPGMLTVAIADPQSIDIFSKLCQLTGCQLFPVLADPFQISHLLKKIERTERAEIQRRYRMRQYASSWIGFPSVHTMIQLLTLPDKKLYHRE